MEDPVELEALIEGVPQTTLAAKLRALMPGIDQRIKDGVRHQDIVDVLNLHGGLGTQLKLRTFRSYLFRYRKKTTATGADGRPRRPATRARVTPGAPVASVPLVRNASDLKRLREQEVDLDELSRIGKNQAGG
jgi:hypothetical protein